jgi:hypothetical protein
VLRQRRTSASSSSRVICSAETLFASGAAGPGERDGSGVWGISPSPFKAPVKLHSVSMHVEAEDTECLRSVLYLNLITA